MVLRLTPRDHFPPPWNPRMPWVHSQGSVWTTRIQGEMNWQLLKMIRVVQRAWTFGNRSKLDKASGLQPWKELHRRCPTPSSTCPQLPHTEAFLDQGASFRSSFVAFSWGLSLGPLRSSHHKLGNREDLVLQSPSAHFYPSLLSGPQPALDLQYFSALSTERVGPCWAAWQQGLVFP